MKKLLLTLFLSSLILTGCGTDVVTPNEEGPTPENPQIPALEKRASTLQAEMEVETTKVAGGERSLANKAAEFQRLALEREFADKQLASALATVSKPSEQLFGTFQDYARDFYKTANDIAALSSLTDAQLTADQITQEILQGQIKALDDQKRVLKDGFAEQVSALDDILTNAQLQLDAANGLNVSVLSVADALNGFASAVSALETTRAGQGLATTVNAATTAVSGQRQTDILSYLQGVNSNTQLSDFEKAQTVYTRAQIEGVTEAEIARAWGASAEETRRWFGNAGVPQFAVGTNYVPRDMLAQIHEGEAIVPKAYNPAANGAGGSNAELVAELRQLRAAYERQQAALDKIEKSTRSTDTTLRNVTPNGDSLQTVAA